MFFTKNDNKVKEYIIFFNVVLIFCLFNELNFLLRVQNLDNLLHVFNYNLTYSMIGESIKFFVEGGIYRAFDYPLYLFYHLNFEHYLLLVLIIINNIQYYFFESNELFDDFFSVLRLYCLFILTLLLIGSVVLLLVLKSMNISYGLSVAQYAINGLLIFISISFIYFSIKTVLILKKK